MRLQFPAGKKYGPSHTTRASESHTTRASETETLKQAYAAFNRYDIPAASAQLDPQIEWTEPAEFPGGGSYPGYAGVQAYLSQSRANWAEGRNQPERCIVAGDEIVVFVPVRVRLKDSQEWCEARIAAVFTLGKNACVRRPPASLRMGRNGNFRCKIIANTGTLCFLFLLRSAMIKASVFYLLRLGSVVLWH